MVSTRIQAFYGPFIGFLPQLGLAAILFVGGCQVIHGHITLGQRLRIMVPMPRFDATVSEIPSRRRRA